MLEQKETLNNNNWTSSVTSAEPKPIEAITLLDEFEKNKGDKLVQIQGTLTSQIWTRKSTDIPYYAFLRRDERTKHSRKVCERTKCKNCEIPIIFRLSSQQKPNLDKNQQAILIGNWAKSDLSHRPSFTVYSFQILSNNHESGKNS